MKLISLLGRAGLHSVLAFSLLQSGSAAAQSPAPAARVVVVELCVLEQSPERVEAALTTPLEKLLLRLPGVDTLNSNTGHGRVALEIHYKGGASEDDAASVTQAVDRSGMNFLSSSVRLDSPRGDGLFFDRRDCGATPR
ncbi:hypothetical protein [Massilia sp. IC2-476]|uniref:hypothetical protein n=1 Tax=Massilia sp. IC2-476 TaxID=2887199 RepID=UPI001D0F9804|nr:hypothetical protein [Massilia sp. IC2-476]MCC2971716.1 hypothetical protein [Massilia sp. IC2-476]